MSLATLGTELANPWRGVDIASKRPRWAGRAALGRDFLQLIGDAQQTVAAQGSPALLPLLGNSADRATDTLLTGLSRLFRRHDTHCRHRTPWRHDRKRRSRWRHRTVLGPISRTLGTTSAWRVRLRSPAMKRRTLDPTNSAPRVLPHNPSHDPDPEEEHNDEPPPPPEQAPRTPHPRCHRARARTLSNHTRTCNKLLSVYQ